MGNCAKLFLLLILLASGPGPAMGQQIKEVRKTVPLASDGALSIETFKGSITITAWDSPQVEIYARIEPDGVTANDIEKVQDTEVRIEPSAGALRIKSDYDKLKHNRSGLFLTDEDNGNLPFVNYTIKMPRTARLDISDHKSITKVAGLRSDLKINTHKGSVSVNGLEGSIDLETHKGDARIEFAGLARESRFHTHKGDIEITVPRAAGFNLDSDLGRGGSLDSDSDVQALLKSGAARSKKYSGPMNGGGPLLRLETFKGHFRLHQQ